MLKNHEHGMCVFPEGTRSDDGNMRPFKAGSLKIATRSGAAIVPFALEHTIDVMPRGSVWIKPLAVRVTFLPAIMPEDYKGKDTSTLSDEIQANIAEIVGFTIVEEPPAEKESEEKA